MAEVIGAIASAITLGSVVTQLAISITRLKDCWDQVRNAPEDLKWLIRDITIFSYVLDDIEADMTHESVASSLVNSKPALQCFKFCSEAANDLDIFIRDLGRDINSSSRLRGAYAAAKMVMQKKKVEHYRTRLQNVTRLLSLSQQCYIRALIQVQPELIANKVALQLAESQSRSNSDSNLMAKEKAHHSSVCNVNNFEFHNDNNAATVGAEIGLIGRRRHHYNVQNNIYSWHLQLPHWMTTKALEIVGLRAPDGWRFALRAYRTISKNSEVVKFAMTGNIQGLQELFTSRQASPFDMIEGNGFTLLHYAGGQKREAVFEFLLNQGADPSIGGIFTPPITPLNHLGWSGNQGGRQPLLPSLYCLLLHSEEIYENSEQTVNGILSRFHGTVEEFIFLQQKCCPSFYQMPKSTRVTVAAQVASGVWDAYHMPELIRKILERDSISVSDIQDICMSEIGWTTLGHSIARKCGRSLAIICSYVKKERSEMQRDKKRDKKSKRTKYVSKCLDNEKQKQALLYRSWSTMFCQFLITGVNLHQVVSRHTLFSSFLKSYFYACDLEKLHSECDLALHMWLADLQAIGIDLEDLGKVEHHLYNSGHTTKDDYNSLWHARRRLISFSYGPSPHDWHIWMSETTDSYVGDFWDLVEGQGEVMPGAWPQDVPYKMS